MARNPHEGKKDRDPRASGRPDLTPADLAAVRAQYGNPVIPNPDTPEYLAALTARDGYWQAMAEGLPNAAQKAWVLEGWRKFYEALGYTKV